MNSTEAIQGDSARLVRELDVTGTGDELHGVTFADSRLVVAAGARLLRLVPHSARGVDQLETFPARGGLAYDGRHLWQLSQGHVQQLQVRTGFVVRSAKLALDGITGLECFEDRLLVLHAGGRTLAHVRMVDHSDWVDANVVAEAKSDVPLRGLAWSAGELWSSTGGALVRIDPGSARILERVALPGAAEICDLACDAEGHLWCVDGRSRTVHVFALPGRPDRARPAELAGDDRPAATGEPPIAMDSPTAVAGATFARILVPIDFSAASRRALATALVLQERLGSEVHIFHLTEEGTNDAFLAATGANAVTPNEAVDDAKEHLGRYVEDFFPGRSAGISLHAHFGADVVRGVEQAAREIGATLVLLTGRPRHSLFRTHVEKIAKDIDAAVMVLWTDGQARPS